MTNMPPPPPPLPEPNPYQSPEAAGTAPPQYVPTGEERLWAMACHLAGLAAFFPFANVVAPLVIWLVQREKMPMVDEHGKESVNFQISMTIYSIVSFFLVFVIVGIFLLIALLIFDLVVIILATVQANEGKPYRYPLCIRFIS